MSTNELPRENRIASELIPDSPPVHPEPLLNDYDMNTDQDLPPRTQLLLTGITREEITADFLDAIHDLADEHDLQVESISVGRPDDS